MTIARRAPPSRYGLELHGLRPDNNNYTRFRNYRRVYTARRYVIVVVASGFFMRERVYIGKRVTSRRNAIKRYADYGH